MEDLESRLKKLKETKNEKVIREDDLLNRYEKLKGNTTETKKKEQKDEIENLLDEILDEISLETDINLIDIKENQETDLDLNSIFKDFKKNQNVSTNEVDELISQVYDEVQLESKEF